MHRIALILLLTFLTSSCSILDPVVYKIAVQQGNIIDQEQIDKLQIGMTKEQVAFVLGTPMVTDAFDGSYWEYLYVLRGSNGTKLTKNLVVNFKDDLLTSFEGNFQEDKEQESDTKTEKEEES